jgi:L-seryl-tRNA(Ser) seleniumtransferase
MTDRRRRIPAVESLLATPPFRALVDRAGRHRVVESLRAVQSDVRAGAGAEPPDAPDWYAAAVAERIDREDQPSLRHVINATGVVLHTNLGRAPLASAARRAVADAAGYATLEYELETGTRGSRHDHCVALLRELTGADAALVVNNNAAAVVLAVNTLAAGGEVVVSRGELVEIGGSFRVPEILARSGARMREVGATNRTHLEDYRAAVGPETALFLKVHRSNFRVEGFTSEVAADALSAAARDAGLPLVHDLGSGALLDFTTLGLPYEPTAREALDDGADVVTLSGDKLLGGPQAGIVLGRADLVARMRENPLCRAMRCDKLTLAALEATLALYRDPERARDEIPVLRMLGASPGSLARRAEELAGRLREAGVAASTVDGTSAIGGGAYPGVELPTTLVVVRPAAGGTEALAGRLRTGRPPVVARVRDDSVLLDPRTVDPTEEDALVAAVSAVAALAVAGPGAAGPGGAGG